MQYTVLNFKNIKVVHQWTFIYIFYSQHITFFNIILIIVKHSARLNKKIVLPSQILTFGLT